MSAPERERAGRGETAPGDAQGTEDTRDVKGVQGTRDTRAAVTAARRRLLAVLGQIADVADERSLERCPYRTAHDVCTFRGECGNRSRPAGGKPVCSGGRLNARGPSPEELAAALQQAERANATGAQADAERDAPGAPSRA